MNYIEILTQEEKSILCGIIPGGYFKEHFKKNEQEFSKIWKGFRAKSLGENLACTIAMKNVDTPFITWCVNGWIDSRLQEIRENIDRLEADGSTHDIALATTMINSVFHQHVDLYLKLSGETMDEEGRSKLRENMEHIRVERAISAEVANRTKAIEEERQRLHAQIEAMQKNADLAQAEYTRKIQEIEREKEALQASLTEAQEKVAELKAAPPPAENEDADFLAQYDDTDSSLLPVVGSEEIVSLCGVISDHNEKKWLIRYADLSYDGHYDLFRRNEDAPPYFTNRDKIFYKDGPSDNGFYGVWTWSSVPSENDPSKDYILSSYNSRLDAIEVVFLSEASSIEHLIRILRNGIGLRLHSRSVMFAFSSSKGKYTGILCNTKELSTVDGRTTFAESCIEVPVYEFVGSDVLRLDNGLSFYRNAFAGLPMKLYQVKRPFDIVKDIVSSSVSWTFYKTRGATRTEYKTFKDFLGAIPENDILLRIEAACHCSHPAAKQFLDDFLATALKYMDGNSIEDEIIASAIHASPELQERTKALIRADWEAEHEALLAEAQQKLDSIDTALSAATTRLTETNEALRKAESEKERLAGVIAEKEKLAEDVEKAVSERIRKARENAAEFIADMAFVSGQPARAAGTETSVSSEVLAEPVHTQYRSFSGFGEPKDSEAHHTWEDVIDTAAFELEEAGVVGKYSRGLAAFLCAAYIEKQPILLVGPNAIDIAHAFRAAIGDKYGMLCCEGSYDMEALTQIGCNGEKVVIVNNLVSSAWINRLPEIFSQKDIFYIATHPYAEDIQVEPKSLYGFMLPLFTEFFVSKKATGQYNGGYFADDFQSYAGADGAHEELKVLSKFALSTFVRRRIENLVTIARDIYPAATADDTFLFAVLPIAYALLAMNELKEAIDDAQKEIKISAGLKRDLQYILGDVQ